MRVVPKLSPFLISKVCSSIALQRQHQIVSQFPDPSPDFAELSPVCPQRLPFRDGSCPQVVPKFLESGLCSWSCCCPRISGPVPSLWVTVVSNVWIIISQFWRVAIFWCFHELLYHWTLSRILVFSTRFGDLMIVATQRCNDENRHPAGGRFHGWVLSRS